jgi:hypothetical protein
MLICAWDFCNAGDSPAIRAGNLPALLLLRESARKSLIPTI